MFTFTNRFGDTVDAPATVDDVEASDVKYLPLWVAAAVKANAEGYCSQYDTLAETLGGPTREDLREAGLLPKDYTVTLTRRVPVTVYVNQVSTVAVSAQGEDEARERALAPHVAYWPGGMYENDVVRLLADSYRYVSLDSTRDWDEPVVSEVTAQ